MTMCLDVTKICYQHFIGKCISKETYCQKTTSIASISFIKSYTKDMGFNYLYSIKINLTCKYKFNMLNNWKECPSDDIN